MMARPYSQLSIEDLEDLLNKHGRDPPILFLLIEELAQRHTKRARNLLSVVAELVAKANTSEAEGETQSQRELELDDSGPNPSPEIITEGSTYSRGGGHRGGGWSVIGAEDVPPDDRRRPETLSRIRPPGTPGLPTPWVRPLNNNISLTLPGNPDLPQIYAAALSALIAEIKQTGAGQKRYELENGIRAEAVDDTLIYEFAFTDDANLFQDAKVEVQIFGKRIEASILSIGPGSLKVSTSEDLGPTVARAALLVDATALLEALKDRIEEVAKGQIKLNRAIADAVAGKAPIPDAPPALVQSPSERNLDRAQQTALRAVLASSVTYVWGPPGCGKTRVLADVVYSAFKGGKRILICSNTNKAVDQLLYQTCGSFGQLELEEGRIVRIGTIADEKLKDKYNSYVTIDGIVARKSVELNAQRESLQEAVNRIDTLTAHTRDVVELFAHLDSAEKALGSCQHTTNEYARKGNALKTDLGHTREKIQELERELANLGGLLSVFKRSEGTIRRDIAVETGRADHLGQEIKSVGGQYADARAKFAAAQEERDRRSALLTGRDRAAAERAVAEADAKRAPLVAELREIDAKISDLRAAVMKEARVLGTTCTKAYLSVSDIGQVDLVIIDEASMVALPVVWFMAGISGERAVICGDFRQIPPIVQTNEQAVFDVLGEDAFAVAGLDQRPADDPRMVMLDTQYRMDQRICGLISDVMYDGLLRTALSRPPAGNAPPAPWDGPLTIVDTSDLWPFESVNAFHSRFNLMHALLVRNLVWHLRKEGYVRCPEDLAVCTPYSAQSRLMRKLLDDEEFGGRVQVGTVHSYQGDERNAIVLELPEGHGGTRMLGQFLQGVPPLQVGARLINVAVSRAKNHLIVLANLTHLDRLLPSSALLRHVLYRMQREGRVISGSELLALRPIESDLRGLFGRVKLDLEAETLGLFTQATFDAAVEADIANARESVVIFSGFVTPTRVAKLGDLLRLKTLQDVKVRCVTRPPHLNGSMKPTVGKEALDALENVGCSVDCRARIHEKVVIIDREIVWHGSLNVLSHTHRTDESMTRLFNAGLARALAANMSKRHQSQEKALGAMAEAENPRCGQCGGRTVYNEGRFGPYFYCEGRCGWKINMKGSQRAYNSNSTGGPDDSVPKDGPKCPVCKGKTTVRSGPYGAFYSCVKYPACPGKARVSDDGAKQTPRRDRNSRPSPRATT
jgi:hypothetical protein